MRWIALSAFLIPAALIAWGLFGIWRDERRLKQFYRERGIKYPGPDSR